MEDTDFSASFDGNRWKVSWTWKGEEPVLRNQCGEYKISDECCTGYEKEVKSWIECGWLVEYDVTKHGAV